MARAPRRARDPRCRGSAGRTPRRARARSPPRRSAGGRRGAARRARRTAVHSRRSTSSSAARALGAAADLQIEREHREPALEVVADGRVEVRLVGLVQLDPRVERRLPRGSGARGPASPCRRAQSSSTLSRKLFARDPAARAQREPIVVAGQPFHHPQARRVRLARVVELEQRARRDPLAVPRVEQLVREQLEQALVRLARRREVRVEEVHARARGARDRRRRRARASG